MAKSGHVIVEFEVKDKRMTDQKDDLKIERRNYSKADLVNMRTFFKKQIGEGCTKPEAHKTSWRSF